MAQVTVLVPKNRVEEFQSKYGEAKGTKEHKDCLGLYYDSDDILPAFDVEKNGSWYTIPIKVNGAQAAAELVSRIFRDDI